MVLTVHRQPMPRFDSANFGAQEGGPYRGRMPASYQGLCRPSRLQAVLSPRPKLAAAVRPAHPAGASMHITKGGHHERRAFGTARHHGGERVRLAGIGTDT